MTRPIRRAVSLTTIYLSADEYEALSRMDGAALAKDRHRLDGWAVDIHLGDHFGLVVAEIECEGEAAFASVEPPAGTVADVTHDDRLSGGQIAQLDRTATEALLAEFGIPRRRPPYDPLLFAGTAGHYLAGRPPYSRQLVPMLTDALGLDGRGCLVDVGCGPGIVTVALAPLFDTVIGIDPDPDMLAAAAAHAEDVLGADNRITWVQGVAEDLAALVTEPVRVMTFAQSFHWTDQERVADTVYGLLEPGGAIVLIGPDADNRPKPALLHPEIPQQELVALAREFLGPVRRGGSGYSTGSGSRFEQVLSRTRFGDPEILFAPAPTDAVRDIDGAIAFILSASWAAPHLFGDRLDEFVDRARTLLARHAPAGLFSDWLGDTIAVVGRKPPTG